MRSMATSRSRLRQRRGPRGEDRRRVGTANLDHRLKTLERREGIVVVWEINIVIVLPSLNGDGPSECQFDDGEFS